jgi:hypothetical protein
MKGRARASGWLTAWANRAMATTVTSDGRDEGIRQLSIHQMPYTTRVSPARPPFGIALHQPAVEMDVRLLLPGIAAPAGEP